MRVLLLVGGWSPEREISLRGAKTLHTALLELGHEVTFFDLRPDTLSELPATAKNHDVAFVNLHGEPGEDGLVQAMLKSVGCPYQGSGPAGSFLALNKAVAKSLFRHAGLLTPDWIFLTEMPAPDWTPNLDYPLFVKSNTGGSSLHLSKAHNREELFEAMKGIFDAGCDVIMEPQIFGKEVTCGVLGGPQDAKALPPILIVPKRAFFDFHDKYSGAAGADEICPAPLPEKDMLHLQDLAEKAHAVLGLDGYSRADGILCDDGSLYLLEVNTLPGMTDVSLVPKAAAVVGLSYAQLVQRLLDLALARDAKGAA